MNRRDFLKSIAVGTAAAAFESVSCFAARQQQPNFIFFITDDISVDDLGCYGNNKIKTPHLDRMASEGVVFDNAYLSISSCSPSRCSIITGRYPHNTGAPELHTTLPTNQYTFPQAFRQAGYYTVLSGKNHMGDVKRAFDQILPGKGPGSEGQWVELLQNRPKDKPFFFWFASTDAHRNWQFDDQAPRYESSQVQVPPFLFDGPKTRQDLTGYYHEISRTDTYAGLLRAELERQGIAENTYFVYCSDNGRPFPRCKTRLYDSGIKTPLIVWAPGHLKPARTDSLVSAVDFSATFLDLAGLPKNKTIQGVSFASVLRNPKAVVRDVVFAEHNWHVFQAHERMVRFKNWLYIRNAWPERQNLCVESASQFPAGEELWRAEDEGKLQSHQRDVFLQPRPSEELYDVVRDPDQLHNLADSEKYNQILQTMRAILHRWIEETGDTVPADPTNDRQNAQGKEYDNHRRGTFPGAERNAMQITNPGPIWTILLDQ
ncbi:MAG: sulfatase-like hydrolase/transferase [Sedimentisphaerales bacterium]|nr:sulfatase-like hydrolase/transferase [Sedimentisphaerales bacterium]